MAAPTCDERNATVKVRSSTRRLRSFMHHAHPSTRADSVRQIGQISTSGKLNAGEACKMEIIDNRHSACWVLHNIIPNTLVHGRPQATLYVTILRARICGVLASLTWACHSPSTFTRLRDKKWILPRLSSPTVAALTLSPIFPQVTDFDMCC